MAGNQNCSARVVYATLAANTVDLVVLTDGAFGVRVTNLNGAAPIWFTVSHPGGSNPVPTIGGALGEWTAASVAGTAVTVRHAAQFGSCVQLTSTGSVSYMVEVVGSQVNA